MSSLASATQIESGKLSVLVDAAYASSLFEFLTEKRVNCLPPKAAVFRTGQAYIDAQGRRQVELDALESEIVATGTMEDFAQWMKEWVIPNH